MTITATTMRYIKLGPKGIWADKALAAGELPFGYPTVNHQLASTKDVSAIKLFLMHNGRSAQAATQDARELTDFYGLGADCLWITFANGHLWWAFAHPEVFWMPQADSNMPVRIRKTINGWSKTDINGKALGLDGLSTKLTKVAAYRRTICAVDAQDYLLGRLNDDLGPLIRKAEKLRLDMIDTLFEAIKQLHWKDFETLVDVIFARDGWHRTSSLGGCEAAIDLVIEQATTGERAAVEVKSIATQSVLNEYIDRADAADTFKRFFFICHSPAGRLSLPSDRSSLHVWTAPEVASKVYRLGLSDWVMAKVA